AAAPAVAQTPERKTTPSVAPAKATQAQPFVNSLDMKFVPVPGTQVLFCIHETRRRDYTAYAAEAGDLARHWENPKESGFMPAGLIEDHPVSRVNWDEAQGFCSWLSKKEGRNYRLPTDREWSIAVGLGKYEKWDQDTTPATVIKLPDEFPWGSPWPPPSGSGNYSDASRKAQAPSADRSYIDGYDDGFPTTALVMSFKPNPFGLYDLGGNVLEWCEDWFDSTKTHRVLRGGNWSSESQLSLRSSARHHILPTSRGTTGFRCVLETGTVMPEGGPVIPRPSSAE
ncbi:MAG: SUMF1/EgtB/PvdO family nonheme iron enzyme, partial [Prosthecobacter sp.]|nr:SUMF1/EgtB/PvdO family nonheme iron enzyme [Prosthecobacter sp.]